MFSEESHQETHNSIKNSKSLPSNWMKTAKRNYSYGKAKKAYLKAAEKHGYLSSLSTNQRFEIKGKLRKERKKQIRLFLKLSNPRII